MRYTADMSDRALYRKACRLAAERGAHEFRRFIERNEYLFAQVEMTRVRRAALDWGWGNLAHFTNQKFRAYRGLPSDPRTDDCTIVQVLITPHVFLRHVL